MWENGCGQEEKLHTQEKKNSYECENEGSNYIKKELFDLWKCSRRFAVGDFEDPYPINHLDF